MRSHALLLSLLLIPFINSCVFRPQVKVDVFSIRDKQVIQWIQQHGGESNHKLMPFDQAVRILKSIRASVEKRVHNHKLFGVYENSMFPLIKNESGYKQFAVGQYDRPNRMSKYKSEGYTQIMHNVAELEKGEKIPSSELFTDVEENIDLGFWQLLSSKSYQAYNAGNRGAKLGWGAKYSRDMKKTFQAMPWIVKLKNGGSNEKIYAELFAVHFVPRHLRRFGHGSKHTSSSHSSS